jgi:hypothetical protein
MDVLWLDPARPFARFARPALYRIPLALITIFLWYFTLWFVSVEFSERMWISSAGYDRLTLSFQSCQWVTSNWTPTDSQGAELRWLMARGAPGVQEVCSSSR